MECLKDPTFAIFFLGSRRFKDIKHHILSSQPVNFLLVKQTRKDLYLVDLILELAFFFSVNHIDWFNFYRTQVNLGSDSWVRMSVRP